jgi:hypothetical protein
VTEPGEIDLARRIMREAFAEGGYEPGSFYHGYVANVAMVLHDMQPEGSLMDFKDPVTRCEAAARVLDKIFGINPKDRESTDGGKQ